MRIFTVIDRYLPGEQGGGAVTALSNLVELLGNEFEFYVVTRDRDLGCREPYPGVGGEKWIPVGKAKVTYASTLSLGKLQKWISEVGPDILYLNSFFSLLTIRTLALRRLGLLGSRAVWLAPRGELGRAALAVKPIRKRAYMFAARSLGLFREINWQASSDSDEERIRAVTGEGGRVMIARDVPEIPFLNALGKGVARTKAKGAARFIFLSRISRNKNLDFALRALDNLQGHIDFEICGPIGDTEYWKQCEGQLRIMPGTVVARYVGTVAKKDLSTVLGQKHFLLLPTGGENFGFAILEALAAGCPVIISDQTPWNDLERYGAGWTLPLDLRRWREVLEECVAMDAKTYAQMSLQAKQYVQQWISSTPFEEEHRRLFLDGWNCRLSETNAVVPQTN